VSTTNLSTGLTSTCSQEDPKKGRFLRLTSTLACGFKRGHKAERPRHQLAAIIFLIAFRIHVCNLVEILCKKPRGGRSVLTGFHAKPSSENHAL
jgi:hypothetical protein